jgi:hypothetical protein
MVTCLRQRYAAFVEPVLEFATAADGVCIAWTWLGSGPALIHLPGVPFSNVVAEWQIPVLRRRSLAWGSSSDSSSSTVVGRAAASAMSRICPSRAT